MAGGSTCGTIARMQIHGAGAAAAREALGLRQPTPGSSLVGLPVLTHYGVGRVSAHIDGKLTVEGSDASHAWRATFLEERWATSWEGGFIHPVSPCGHGNQAMRCVAEPNHSGPHVYAAPLCGR